MLINLRKRNFPIRLITLGLALGALLLPSFSHGEKTPGLPGSASPADQKLSPMQKKALAKELTHQALTAYKAKHYQQARELAQRLRDLNIPGEKAYLENARKIILAASKKQKDIYEPKLIEAVRLYTQGDYQGSLTLCEAILKDDPTFDDAQRCAEKAKGKLRK
jgi:hypothetical protein